MLPYMAEDRYIFNKTPQRPPTINRPQSSEFPELRKGTDRSLESARWLSLYFPYLMQSVRRDKRTQTRAEVYA